jgi:N-hydroxyarylamine O-acetyltransferase
LPDWGFDGSAARQSSFSERLEASLVRRYLGLLGVAPQEPSLSTLRELVQAHLTRIPFENISKLYYWKREGLTGVPDIHRFLDGIEEHHLGGTCYCNNFHFYSLLTSLNYHVKLCAADMTKPDVHMVSMVTVEGREYLVDAGYAAPFLLPMPRYLTTDHEIKLGGDAYVLKPQDAAGRSRMELYRNGVLKHGYLAKPEPKCLDDFWAAISDSFQQDATFLNSLLLARFWPGRSVVIHNFTLIESQGNKSTIHELAGCDELVDKVEDHFGISWPIVAEVVGGLGALQDAWR